MATIIKIDDKEYDLDSLSESAKSQLLALQFIDGEMQRLNARAAVYQTARNAHSQALKEALAQNSKSDKKKWSAQISTLHKNNKTPWLNIKSPGVFSCAITNKHQPRTSGDVLETAEQWATRI